jgi:hypothetical protein
VLAAEGGVAVVGDRHCGEPVERRLLFLGDGRQEVEIVGEGVALRELP